MGKRSCHSLRIILKSSTAERSQNNHFIAARHSHIQDPGQAFLMQCLLLCSRHLNSIITVSGIHPIGRKQTQIRCCTGDHIHRVPIFFRKRCRCRGIGFEYNDSRRIDAVIIVDRILHISVRRIKSSPHFLRIQAEIQRRTTAQTFLLGRASLGHTTSGIRR